VAVKAFRTCGIQTGRLLDTKHSRESALEFIAVMKDIPFTETPHANAINSAPGKAARGLIPLMLTLQAIHLSKNP
jgi:hypothetical protein